MLNHLDDHHLSAVVRYSKNKSPFFLRIGFYLSSPHPNISLSKGGDHLISSSIFLNTSKKFPPIALSNSFNHLAISSE